MNAAIATYSGPVLPEWIDGNDHVGFACYQGLGNKGTAALLARAGLDDAYRQASGATFFQAELHICFEAELWLRDEVEVRSWVVGTSPKAIHHYHEIFRIPQNVRVASVELVTLHIDRMSRRTAAIPSESRCRLQAISDDQPLPTGNNIGARMGLR